MIHQGLLRFAMDATKAEDAPNTEGHNFAAMDPERRQFLGMLSTLILNQSSNFVSSNSSNSMCFV